MDAQYTRRDESKLLLSVTGAAAEPIAMRPRSAHEGPGAYGYVTGKDPPSGPMKVHPAQAETVRRIPVVRGRQEPALDRACLLRMVGS